MGFGNRFIIVYKKNLTLRLVKNLRCKDKVNLPSFPSKSSAGPSLFSWGEKKPHTHTLISQSFFGPNGPSQIQVLNREISANSALPKYVQELEELVIKG